MTRLLRWLRCKLGLCPWQSLVYLDEARDERMLASRCRDCGKIVWGS